MTEQELFQKLTLGCRGGSAAIRSITKLQPVEGTGGKVFPPTYADSTYAFETRMVDGNGIETVLLDSVQSQANRFEEALLDACRSGALSMPLFEMSVAGHDVTSLTVPHRVHDAILRDALWDGKLFRDSPNGRRLVQSRAWTAAPFFEFAPTVLLFGTWDSQGGGGVNTAKVARCLVSEIVAIDAQRGVRTSSRIDPLGIKLVRDVIAKTQDGEIWKFLEPSGTEKKAKKDEAKTVRPSEINHGNIAPTITDAENGPGGVTFREAVQATVLSLTQIRKLRFPDADGKSSEDRDIAGRVVVAALGLYAVTLAQEDGYQLRSRCQLIPVETPKFELIGRTQQECEPFTLESSAALETLNEALAAAERLGLKWHSGSIRLEPRPDLVKLVEHSDRSTAVTQES